MAGRIIRKRFCFSGAVQGVGFRWRARHAAECYGATGWVRNERDGSVTMELQGSEETIERVLDAVERGAYIHIDGMDVRSLPVVTDERGFSARGDW
ncbi:MAG: acylphosphatase [Oscillospiraceae bacterium]|nr:acylphosphatase [Oscillospiraceae bacterium]